MTVKEAIAELDKVTTDSYCIELDIWTHKGDPQREPEWSVWLVEHKAFYRGPTMLAAVGSALAALKPDEATAHDRMDDVEAQIRDVERLVAR